MSGEQPPSPESRLTPAQEAALERICERYEVEYNSSHYYVYPPDSFMMPNWAEGWVGGPSHSGLPFGESAHPANRKTIYVGVSPEGEVHS